MQNTDSLVNMRNVLRIFDIMSTNYEVNNALDMNEHQEEGDCHQGWSCI